MQRNNDRQKNSLKVSNGGLFTASQTKDHNITANNISVDETSEVNIVAKGAEKVTANNINCQNGSNVTIAAGLNPADALQMFLSPRRK